MDVSPIPSVEVKNRIRDLRKCRELTQEQLARAIGVSRQSIISVEMGRSLPSISLALAMARFFDSPLEQLFVVESNQQSQKQEENMRSLYPFRGGDLHDAIDRMVDESLTPFRAVGAMAPQMNVYQTDTDIVVEADVPGMREEDLDIEISDGVLTIKGERKEETEEKNKEYFHREVSYGSFHRAVTLPVDVEAEKAEAEVKNGQLKIIIPKIVATKPKAHKVTVKKS